MKIKVNEDIIDGDFEISGGRNVEVKMFAGKLMVDAPLLNQTRLKYAEFDLKGDCIEIRGGKGIKITTAHPNVLIISSHYNEIEAAYSDLQKRFDNLERLFLERIKNDNR